MNPYNADARKQKRIFLWTKVFVPSRDNVEGIIVWCIKHQSDGRYYTQPEVGMNPGVFVLFEKEEDATFFRLQFK